MWRTFLDENDESSEDEYIIIHVNADIKINIVKLYPAQWVTDVFEIVSKTDFIRNDDWHWQWGNDNIR